MEKSKKSINLEGGFLFCGGWNFSKSVSVGPTFIGEMRVKCVLSNMLLKTLYSKELYRHRGGKRSQFCSSM